jgi:hypothetical protein
MSRNIWIIIINSIGMCLWATISGAMPCIRKIDSFTSIIRKLHSSSIKLNEWKISGIDVT